MHSTLQLEMIKKLLKEQHGVPDSICDSLDNIYRLCYREGYADAEENAKDEDEEE